MTPDEADRWLLNWLRSHEAKLQALQDARVAMLKAFARDGLKHEWMKP